MNRVVSRYFRPLFVLSVIHATCSQGWGVEAGEGGRDSAAPTAAAREAGDIRVMSFNIRYGTARDGENHWDRRKEFLVETILAFHPDLLGTQETLAFQRDFLAAKLTEYEPLGVGRNDGREDGEMMALFYKRERFEKLGGGHFWLSETPDKVGSQSWDSSLPRMVTWIKLRDRQRTAAPPLVLMNTHFDHQGPTARLESARLLRRQVAILAKNCAAIITGDFNTDEGSAPYQTLFEAAGEAPSPLVDSYRAAHPERAAEEGTFSGFRADATRGPRIDWIGVSRGWEIRAAAIERTARNGRTPSDHFPVTAILRSTLREDAATNAADVTAFPDAALRFEKVLFLGNSITLHGPAPDIGWRGNWGMAASSQEKDYVHRLLERIGQSANVRPIVKVKNIAEFERRLEGFNVQEGLKEELAFEADLVVVAIGENVSALTTDEAKARYRAAFVGLLAELKKHGRPALFVRSSFWADPAKDEIMKSVCQDGGEVFVDIGKLGRDESNFARSERKIEHAGVAAHPGDKGMEAIADEIWTAIRRRAALPKP